MTQFVLLILPATEGEESRVVGPFLAEHLANQWADSREIARHRRLVWPLEPTNRSVYGQGRHALIPSPTPRTGLLGMLDQLEEIGPPEVAAGALAAWEEKKAAARIDVSPMTGGKPVTSWITEEGLALEPARIVGHATHVANWKGTVARFGVPTVDGRTLRLGEDPLQHFASVPWPLQVVTSDGPRIVGIVERVHVEQDRLEAEGRISIDELAKLAPEMMEPGLWKDRPAFEWPAGVDVQGGYVQTAPQRSGPVLVHGPWVLMAVVITTSPAWPDCSISPEFPVITGGPL